MFGAAYPSGGMYGVNDKRLVDMLDHGTGESIPQKRSTMAPTKKPSWTRPRMRRVMFILVKRNFSYEDGSLKRTAP